MLTRSNFHSLLVIGIDVVSLATSAKRAGYKVYAADYFGDQDLKRLCDRSLSIVQQRPGVTCGRLSTSFNPGSLLPLARELLEKNAIDGTLVSSGLDDSPDVLFELNDTVPIIGNQPDIINKVRDKTKFFQELKRLGIPYPETAIARDLEEAKVRSKDIGYPVLVKPSRGFGGADIRKVKKPQRLGQAFQAASLLDEKVLIQEYVSGIPASVSMVSSSDRAITLTLNEQLLGMGEVGHREPFGYGGNIIPLVTNREIMYKIKRISEKIMSHFTLVGSNGIDLVMSKDGVAYVVEVNPRFQGTIECVERILNMNLVKAHVEACVQGKLATIKENLTNFCVRLILFAPQDSIVPDLSIFREVRDIPMPRVIIEKGEPVCSVVIGGKTRSSALKKARSIANLIHQRLIKSSSSEETRIFQYIDKRASRYNGE